MNISCQHSTGDFNVSGQLDIDSVDALRESLLHYVQKSPVVLDLSEVGSIDTASMQVLLAAQKDLIASGKPFSFTLSSAIAEMASALGFSFSTSTIDSNQDGGSNMSLQPNPVETFLQEAEELLAEIEGAALSLEPKPSGEDEAVNQIFRAFHTIKGSGAMFGFDELAAFTHHVESLLDQVREGAVSIPDDLSNVILASTDHIKLLLLASQGGDPVNFASQQTLLERINRLGVAAHSSPRQTVKTIESTVSESNRSWHIRFRPDPAILSLGGNPFLLFRDLRKLGDCTIQGHLDNLPDLANMQPDVCYLRWTASVCEMESRRNSMQVKSREANVRVPAERLDRLVNLVGELVMNQSRLATATLRFQAPELAGPVEEIERLIGEMRDEVLQIRMMPIGTIFGRFRRLVHDLSIQLNKEVELVTEGEKTELDQLAEPLVHLLRNSLDHGIESSAKRIAKGKPKQAKIRLTASHRGSDVIVTIEDDGAGLDRAAIRAKAVAKQLIAADANLTDKETLNLILLPGFSTAESITSVSGRGVGMDVVKRQIDALRGTLTITSEQGRGSCIVLILPFTLAIIDGLLVEVAEGQYIIPMAVVTENVELPLRDRTGNNGRNVVAVRGDLIPYIDLRGAFHFGGNGPLVSKIVLVRCQDQRIGLVVDRVLGTHQTVIQALGKFLLGIEVVSGSTIMGDGRVALILDITGVVRLAERQSQNFTAQSGSTSLIAA